MCGHQPTRSFPIVWPWPPSPDDGGARRRRLSGLRPRGRRPRSRQGKGRDGGHGKLYCGRPRGNENAGLNRGARRVGPSGLGSREPDDPLARRAERDVRGGHESRVLILGGTVVRNSEHKHSLRGALGHPLWVSWRLDGTWLLTGAVRISPSSSFLVEPQCVRCV